MTLQDIKVSHEKIHNVYLIYIYSESFIQNKNITKIYGMYVTYLKLLLLCY